MNIIVKSAVAGALALGATGAFAMGQPWSNSSDLILLVENTTTGASYGLDTGISMNTLLPSGSLISGATLDQTLAGVSATIAASATLQSFLAANPASGDGWQLIGGQYNGGSSTTAININTKAPGNAKYAYTSTIAANQGTKGLTDLQNFFNIGLQTDVTTGGTLNGLTTAVEITSTSALAPQSIQKYGTVAGDSLQALGSTAFNLYAFTGNGTTGQLQSYIQGTATLDANGTLTFAGNGGAPVPLPAAVWLLGSGLMGLVGVSRRRKAAV